MGSRSIVRASGLLAVAACATLEAEARALDEGAPDEGAPFGVGSVADAFLLSPANAERLAPLGTAAERPDFHFDIAGFYEHVRLGTVTEDVIAANFQTGDSTKLGEVDLDNVERSRAGVNARFGTENIAGELSLFGERFEPFDTFRLAGMSMGAVGTPKVERSGDVAMIFDYALRIGFAAGSGDVAFIDSLGNRFHEDGSIVYLSEQVRFGVGIDVKGFQLTVGGIADYLQGAIDVDVDDNINFDGSNLGGYASLVYAGHELPLYARLEGFLGDVEGASIELGVRF